MSGTVSRLGNIFEDVAIKAPVRLASTLANLVLSGLQSIDGVAGADGDRVLMAAQADATQNGIWQMSTGPWQRTADSRGNTDFIDGSLVPVARGSANAGKLFQLQCVDSPVVIGASVLAFASQGDVLSAQQSATSTSSVAIGTGTKTFAIPDGKNFAPSQFVLAYETSNPSNAMLVQISVYSAGSLVGSSVSTGGSGTHADWTIVLANSPASAGRIPPVGTGNVAGPGSATAGHLATYADATGKVLVDAGIAPGALASRTTLLYGDAGTATVPQSALVPGSAPLPYCGAQPSDNLRLGNDASNPTRDINVSAGRCRDDSDATNLHMTAPMVKRLDAAWAAGGAPGSPAGACDTGTKGAGQTWHIFLIGKRGMAITSVSRTSNVATITVAAQGAGAGGTVRAFGMGQGLDVLTPIAAVTTNTISYANNGPDIGATSVAALADVYDVVASQSYAAPTLPSGWTVKQCIGSFIADGSGNIRAITQIGDTFILAAPVTDVNAIASTAARVAATLTVPAGVAVHALFRGGINVGAGASAATIFTSLNENDQAAVFGTIADLSNVTNTYASGSFARLTNTSGQIGVRSANTVATVTISTYGWRDPRRRLF